jgi:hypothetical protein
LNARRKMTEGPERYPQTGELQRVLTHPILMSGSQNGRASRVIARMANGVVADRIGIVVVKSRGLMVRKVGANRNRFVSAVARGVISGWSAPTIRENRDVKSASGVARRDMSVGTALKTTGVPVGFGE